MLKFNIFLKISNFDKIILQYFPNKKIIIINYSIMLVLVGHQNYLKVKINLNTWKVEGQ